MIKYQNVRGQFKTLPEKHPGNLKQHNCKGKFQNITLFIDETTPGKHRMQKYKGTFQNIILFIDETTPRKHRMQNVREHFKISYYLSTKQDFVFFYLYSRNV